MRRSLIDFEPAAGNPLGGRLSRERERCGGVPISVSLTDNLVRAGVNYKFNF